MNIRWVKNTRAYGSGEILMLGKWEVGGWHYSGCLPKAEGPRNGATCNLPGIKGHLGRFHTTDEAKALVERLVRHWIKKALELSDGQEKASEGGEAARGLALFA
jgi:hypothetical protein